MSLVVNTNMSSLTAQRSIAGSDRALETAMERLSSGKRINSASDDAAGLAIVERMTAQVKGLNVAIRNANDGIAMTQSIEGALVEVTDMLQRIRELAVQSANDTNSGTDRGYIQEEVVLLQAELSRVASNTRYNGQLVLDGNFTSKFLHVGTEAQERISISVGSVAANSLGAYTYDTPGIAAITPATTVPDNPIATGTLTVMGNGAAKAITIADDSSAYTNAALINEETGETGVSAEARTYAKLTFDDTTNYAIKINGTAVGSFAAAPDSVSDAVAKINAVSGTTEVTATAAADGLSVMLFNSQGKDITIQIGFDAGCETQGACREGSDSRKSITVTSYSCQRRKLRTSSLKLTFGSLFCELTSGRMCPCIQTEGIDSWDRCQTPLVVKAVRMKASSLPNPCLSGQWAVK
jgi:flagellin